MPYITASIIVQLLAVVIPRFEQLKKLGQAGQAKLTQYTRYLTIGLGILQSTAFLALAINGQMFPGCTVNDQIIPDQSAFALIVLVLTMTAGTAAIMWMGELITDRGIGNGMSILIFTSIAARIPAEGKNILDNQGAGGLHRGAGDGARHHRRRGVRRAGSAAAAGAVRQTDDRPQDVRRHVDLPAVEGEPGRRHPGHLRDLAALPAAAAGAAGRRRRRSNADGTRRSAAGSQFLQLYVVNQSSWVHILLYFALIIFFTYFYVGITFNPTERADELKKYGGFIPGIRPGRPTAEYLQFVLSRITLPGSIYLGIVAILPNLFLEITGEGNNQNFPFGGTAVLIMVGVGLDTVKQIETQLMQRNYEGFLR